MNERVFDLLGEPTDELERHIQRTWLEQRPYRTDIGLMHRDGTWLILRVMPVLPRQWPDASGKMEDQDKVVWRCDGDRMLLFRSYLTRFEVLAQLLEDVPDAVVLTSTTWGEEA